MRHGRSLALGGLTMLLAIGVGFAACGKDADPLSDAERAIAALDAGRIDFTLAATAPADPSPAGRIGFRMQGPFAIEKGSKYPTLDMQYTTLLGHQERVTRVVSDGHAVHVMEDGVRTDVRPADARFLRLGEERRGFKDLGVAGWVDDPTVVERTDGTRVITGAVDVADLLSDLARISGQARGGGDVDGLNGDGARRLQRLVRHSEFTAELDRARLPRTLRAVVDFGRDLPAELRTALGPYASPRLEITLAVQPAEH